jgi:hypothetical protein
MTDHPPLDAQAVALAYQWRITYAQWKRESPERDKTHPLYSKAQELWDAHNALIGDDMEKWYITEHAAIRLTGRVPRSACRTPGCCTAPLDELRGVLAASARD